MVYGKLALSLTRDQRWIFSTMGFDTYNFEMHSWKDNVGRNLGTIFGGILMGSGTPFDISLHGIAPVAP